MLTPSLVSKKSVLIVVISLNILLLTYIRFGSSKRELAQEMPVERNNPGVIPKQQQDRVTEFIQIAGDAKSIDDASNRLDDYRNDAVSTILANATEQTASFSDSALLNAVLKDRRVSRLYGLLKDLPVEARTARCRSLFDEKLRILAKKWAKYSVFFKDAKTLTGSQDLYWSHHAVRSVVFLNALLCPASDVHDVCDIWGSTMSMAMEDSGVNYLMYEKRLGVPIQDVFPDELYVLNIYLIVAHVHSCGLKNAATDEISNLHIERRSFLDWNTALGASERAQDVLVANLPYVGGWGGIRKPDRDNAIQWVKLRLRGCGLIGR